MPAKTSALLVTGMPRSATTWVGRVISSSPKVHFVNEPFNPNVHDGVTGQRIGFPDWFTRLDNGNAAQYEGRLDRVYASWWRPTAPRKQTKNRTALRSAMGFSARAAACKLRGGIPLYKDPIALLSADWLAKQYNLSVIVMMRHPLSFVGSMKRRQWAFDFNNFANQPAVVDGVLSDYADVIRQECDEPSSIVVRSALLWKMLMHAIKGYQAKHTEWRFERAEDMAAEPLERVTQVCDWLGLTLDDEIKKAVAEMAAKSNPTDVETGQHWWKRNVSEVGDLWKERLTQDEIKAIRDITEPEWRAFYDEDSWE